MMVPDGRRPSSTTQVEMGRPSLLVGEADHSPLEGEGGGGSPGRALPFSTLSLAVAGCRVVGVRRVRSCGRCCQFLSK